MLETFVIPTLGNDKTSLIFQQDGAPPHFSLKVRDFLDKEFPGRWIGRGGPLAWPPRSPDLSPLDFFFWGYVKQLMYTPAQPANLTDLKERIRVAVRSVTSDMLKRTWDSMKKRLSTLTRRGGSHVEI